VRGSLFSFLVKFGRLKLTLYIYIYIHLAPTSQSKHCILYKDWQLILLREINTAYCDNYSELMNAPCGKILDFLEVLNLCQLVQYVRLQNMLTKARSLNLTCNVKISNLWLCTWRWGFRSRFVDAFRVFEWPSDQLLDGGREICQSVSLRLADSQSVWSWCRSPLGLMTRINMFYTDRFGLIALVPPPPRQGLVTVITSLMQLFIFRFTRFVTASDRLPEKLSR
jgi:hypothetical protein